MSEKPDIHALAMYLHWQYEDLEGSRWSTLSDDEIAIWHGLARAAMTHAGIQFPVGRCFCGEAES